MSHTTEHIITIIGGLLVSMFGIYAAALLGELAQSHLISASMGGLIYFTTVMLMIHFRDKITEREIAARPRPVQVEQAIYGALNRIFDLHLTHEDVEAIPAEFRTHLANAFGILAGRFHPDTESAIRAEAAKLEDHER